MLEEILKEIKALGRPESGDAYTSWAIDRAAACGFEVAKGKITEIIRRHMEDDGWTPCGDRIPEKDGFYIATLDGEIVGEDKPFSGLAEFKDGKWVDDEDDYQCIIAWQPLPLPYRPKQKAVGGDYKQQIMERFLRIE